MLQRRKGRRMGERGERGEGRNMQREGSKKKGKWLDAWVAS